MPRRKREITTTQILAILRGFLNPEGGRIIDGERWSRQQQNLWYVLTALRGPDLALDPGLKLAITCIIRAKVFGEPIVDNEKYLGTRHDLEMSSHYGRDHFLNHAKAAFEALGLKWDKVNQ